MRLGQPVIRRRGVMHKVRMRKRSVQIPVVSLISSSGFALSRPLTVAQMSKAIGTMQTRNTAGLRIHQGFNPDLDGKSVILAEVHSGIHVCNAVPVAVEHGG